MSLFVYWTPSSDLFHFEIETRLEEAILTELIRE